MGNRCYIEFDPPPQDISSTKTLYEGTVSDDEECASFSFEGPPGLLDRLMNGTQDDTNEMLGRIYMGCSESGQDTMDFHWDKGFHGDQDCPEMRATISIEEATAPVFAEHNRQLMEQQTPAATPGSRPQSRM